MILLPFIISGAIGYLLLGLLTKKAEPLNLTLKIILAIGLGLAISSHLTFYSFLIFDQLEPTIVIAAHVIILCVLLFLTFWTGDAFINGSGPAASGLYPPRQLKPGSSGRGLPSASPEPKIPNYVTYIVISLLIVFIIPCVIIQARFYPYGGWDAWQVWNFKAKFLLLAGDDWRNLFSPDLWRTSPHYPLLLPLINVWAWLFTEKPVDIIPMITSITFTLLTAALVAAALWQKTRSIFCVLPAFLLLSLPFSNLLGTTQYCDIVLSFYLLAAIITMKDYPAVSGLMTGFLVFTKPEGFVAGLILGAILVVLTVLDRKNFSFAQAQRFFTALGVASLPAIAFHFWLSPGNQTFINGLTSTVKPMTMERLQMILGFIGIELINGKWNGLWFLLLLGIIIGGKNLWTTNKITAGFLILYLAVIIAYYQVNTYFEIKWWLSVSLNRILFSLLPLFFFWIFCGILETKKRD